MNRNSLQVKHITIDLDQDIVLNKGVMMATFTDFKKKLLAEHRELCMMYKMCTKYNFDEEGTIRYIIAWDSVIGELIKRKLI